MGGIIPGTKNVAMPMKSMTRAAMSRRKGMVKAGAGAVRRPNTLSKI
jgi:hypothetical protein